MKILGVCGSPRKGATEYALRQALEAAAAEGCETELILLRGKKIAPCCHCNLCLKDKTCVRCVAYKDDMMDLYDKFYDADGYILASPVYEMNVSPQICAFFSRFRPTWQLKTTAPDFFTNKLGAAMSVGMARNGGQEKTNDALIAFLMTMGITTISGPAGAYNGALLHAYDQYRAVETVMEDTAGLENARAIARKMARMLLKKI
ncbi:MAG: flavodoxin family protein [Bacillota bacterium]